MKLTGTDFWCAPSWRRLVEVKVGILTGVLVCDEISISISSISGGKQKKQTVGLIFLMRSVLKEAGGSKGWHSYWCFGLRWNFYININHLRRKTEQTVGLRFLMRSVPKEAGGSLVFRRTQNSRAGQPMRQEGRVLFSYSTQIHFVIWDKYCLQFETNTTQNSRAGQPMRREGPPLLEDNFIEQISSDQIWFEKVGLDEKRSNIWCSYL